MFKFDYSKYELKNKTLNHNSFDSTYSIFYNNLLSFLKKGFSFIGLFKLTKKLESFKYVNKNICSSRINYLTSTLSEITNTDIDAI